MMQCDIALMLLITMGSGDGGFVIQRTAIIGCRDELGGAFVIDNSVLVVNLSTMFSRLGFKTRSFKSKTKSDTRATIQV